MGKEDLLAPVVRQVEAGSLSLEDTRQLSSSHTSVGGLQTHGLAQGWNGELREEAFWLA